MGVTDHLKRYLRRVAKELLPIRRIVAQRNALLQENRELRALLAHGAAAGAEEAALRNLGPLMHRPFGLLKATPGISAGETADDRRMVERVLKAYKVAAGPASVTPTAIWREIHDTRQWPLHQLILQGDHQAVTALLRRPGDSDLFWGFDVLVREYVSSYDVSSAASMAPAKMGQDHLLRVAEIIGAVRTENPESPGSMPMLGIKPTDELLAAIDEVMGCEILFPNPFPDEIGIQTRRGVASYRAIHALYQAWRIRELVRGIRNPRVLELGGGLGRTAYYARQLGIVDYTIIDLPFTGFSQGYFLMRTLGEDQVALQGETGGAEPRKVKILNPGSFLESTEHYDLVVNVDSLTEMDRPTAERYWHRIQAATPLFLSINHESNPFTVKELIDADDTRIVNVHRYPYAIRRGYVEELVQLKRPAEKRGAREP